LLPPQQLPQLRMDLLEMVGAHSLYHLLEGNYHHQGLWSQVD
jgi:predicted metal-dependent hydrolase